MSASDAIARQFDAVAAAAEEAPTLRALGMRDPIPGAPLVIRDGDQEVELDPGAWGLYADLKTGLPPTCPVIPLGVDGDVAFFLDTLGSVYRLDAKSSGKGPIGFLFKGRSRWLEWAWPRLGAMDKVTKRPKVNGWDADDARQALVDAAAVKGVFALEDRVRGRGAWRGDDGGLVLHVGDAVLIDGKWLSPGEHGRHIYPARPRIGRPALKAARAGDKGEGATLLKAMQSWNWARDIDPYLLLGWTMTALVGGALTQRPVAFVAGPEGTGKSFLQALLRGLAQDGLLSTANATAAWIYQSLGQDSLPVFADEMEAKEDTRATDRIIELARVSFSGDTLGRGGKEGKGSTSRLMSSFVFSCIVRPPIDAQDASRQVALELRARDRDAPDVLKALGWTVEGGLVDGVAVGKVGAALLKRWLDHWPRWEGLRRAAHDFLRTLGHTARSADAFAPLMAAAHLAIHDGEFTCDQLLWWGGELDASTLEETAGREDTWRRCLSHLLDTPSDNLRSNNLTRTVGQILSGWRDKMGKPEFEHPDALRDEARDVGRDLERVGLALSFPKGCDHDFRFARLFVPVKDPRLHALFEGTPWAGRLGQPGPWAGVLRQAPEPVWETGTSDKGRLRPVKGLMIDLNEAMK